MLKDTKTNKTEQDKARIIEENISRLISEWHASFEQSCYGAGAMQTTAETQK